MSENSEDPEIIQLRQTIQATLDELQTTGEAREKAMSDGRTDEAASLGEKYQMLANRLLRMPQRLVREEMSKWREAHE